MFINFNKFTANKARSNNEINNQALAEFCNDISYPFVFENGGLHLMVGPYLFCLFVNEVTDEFDITIDTYSKYDSGFARNIEWESYDTLSDAWDNFQDKIHYYNGKILGLLGGM